MSGTIHFQIPHHKEDCDLEVYPNGTLLDEDCAKCVQQSLVLMQHLYSNILDNYDVRIEFLEVNFMDGWMDYSIEGKDAEEACADWKEANGIPLIPNNTP